jgi:hypothetical protein
VKERFPNGFARQVLISTELHSSENVKQDPRPIPLPESQDKGKRQSEIARRALLRSCQPSYNASLNRANYLIGWSTNDGSDMAFDGGGVFRTILGGGLQPVFRVGTSSI